MSNARYDETCRMQDTMKHVVCKIRWNMSNASYDGTCRIQATMEQLSECPRHPV
jgi:hypothetical protein